MDEDLRISSSCLEKSARPAPNEMDLTLPWVEMRPGIELSGNVSCHLPPRRPTDTIEAGGQASCGILFSVLYLQFLYDFYQASSLPQWLANRLEFKQQL